MIARPALDAIQIRCRLFLNHHATQGRAARHVTSLRLDDLEHLRSKRSERNGGIEISSVLLGRHLEHEQRGIEAGPACRHTHEHIAMIGGYEKSAFHTRR